MTLTALSTLALITLAAVISPLLADLTARVGIPDVVILIALGILIGPEVLAVAHPDVVIDTLSYMGLSYLMFLAGYELDLNRIRGRPLRLAAVRLRPSPLLPGTRCLLAGAESSPLSSRGSSWAKPPPRRGP